MYKNMAEVIIELEAALLDSITENKQLTAILKIAYGELERAKELLSRAAQDIQDGKEPPSEDKGLSDFLKDYPLN